MIIHPRLFLRLLAIVGLIVAMAIVGQLDSEEAERQETEYCEMVKLWKQTNGKEGWPAYNGEGVCK